MLFAVLEESFVGWPSCVVGVDHGGGVALPCQPFQFFEDDPSLAMELSQGEYGAEGESLVQDDLAPGELGQEDIHATTPCSPTEEEDDELIPDEPLAGPRRPVSSLQRSMTVLRWKLLMMAHGNL